jgi:dynein heavy chain
MLDATDPKEIAEVMAKLVHYVRFIWTRSKYYNSNERIMGLLQKLNNQLINKCTEKISLDDIFHKDVLISITYLDECTHTCESWKSLYREMTASYWNYDENSIFAQLDAFIQRCRDLLEVCEAQIQFARKTTGGEKLPVPQFGNNQKIDLSKGYIYIQLIVSD